MKYPQLVAAMPASVQDWLDHELEMRGIDAVVYTRYILSILQQENFECEPLEGELFPSGSKRNLKEAPVGKGKGKSKLRADRHKLLDCEEMKKSAAVECLMSVSEQKCGIEKLVDELCAKLKSIQSEVTDDNHSPEIQCIEEKTEENTVSLASSSPEEQAEKYYAAFPALSGTVEPGEEPVAQIKESMTRSVWDGKNVFVHPASGRCTPREILEKEGVKFIEKEEKELSEDEPHKNIKAQEQNTYPSLSKGYFKIKTEGTAAKNSKVKGNLWLKEEFAKPSFIVPKYKTNGTSRQRVPFFKGKSPFNVPKQMTLGDNTAKSKTAKSRNGERRFLQQHSEENTEDSSLDNSFDEEFPARPPVIKNETCHLLKKHSTEKKNCKSQHCSLNDRKEKTDKVNNTAAEDGDEKILAVLAAKFNESVAAIWSDGKPELEPRKNLSTEDIWQALPSESEVQANAEVNSLSSLSHISNRIAPETVIGENSVWPLSSMDSIYHEFTNCDYDSLPLEDLENVKEQCCIVKLDSGELESDFENSETRAFFGEVDKSIWKFRTDQDGTENRQFNTKIQEYLWNSPKEYAESWSPPFDSDQESLFEDESRHKDRASPCREEELQLIWEVLGALGKMSKGSACDEPEECFPSDKEVWNSPDAVSSYSEDPACTVSAWNNENSGQEQGEDKLLDLKIIWTSMPDYEGLPEVVVDNSVSEYECISICKAVGKNETWESVTSEGVGLTRSYDSYLNKAIQPEDSVQEFGNSFHSEPTLSTKNCTLTYHKGESCFVEVKPTPKSERSQFPPQPPIIQDFKQNNLDCDNEEHENLLTSPKTHFRPIRQDSCETDTTGSSENGEENQAAHKTPIKNEVQAVGRYSEKRQDLECSPTALLAYKDHDTEDSLDELKFLPKEVGSNMEKFCQTDEACIDSICDKESSDSGKFQEDSCTQLLNAVIDALDNMLTNSGFVSVDENSQDESDIKTASSRSISPASSKEDTQDSYEEDFESVIQPLAIEPVQFPVHEFGNPLYDSPNVIWKLDAEILGQDNITESLVKWSTAQEENLFWSDEEKSPVWDLNKDSDSAEEEKGDKEKCLPEELEEAQTKQISSSDAEIKSLRQEIKEEEEKLFEDIDHIRDLDVWDDVSSQQDALSTWSTETLKSDASEENADEDDCPELELINNRYRIYNSSSDQEVDGEGAYADGTLYSDYFFELQNLEGFFTPKLPVVPTNKAVYSSDLEEEWRKNGKPFDVQVPKKNKARHRSQHKRPCSFYLEGNCRRSDCKFSHDLASITCRFWEEGSCFKGITCPFLHGYQSDPDKENACEKQDFHLELESETQFPALVKAKSQIQKQEQSNSSSSDSTPLLQSKRRRKRFPTKQRNSSPRLEKLFPKSQKTSCQQELKKQNKSSSSDEDTKDI